MLQTQLDESPAMASWAHSLNLLSQQLKASDPDIRSLLDNGPSDLGVLSKFVTDNRTDLGVTFANLATTGQLMVRHLGGIEMLFELYPSLAAGSYTVLGPNAYHPELAGALGFEVNFNDPPDCGAPASGPRRLQRHGAPQSFGRVARRAQHLGTLCAAVPGGKCPRCAECPGRRPDQHRRCGALSSRDHRKHCQSRHYERQRAAAR